MIMSYAKGGKKAHNPRWPLKWIILGRNNFVFDTERLSVPPPSFQQCGLRREADKLLLFVIDGEQRLRVICLNEPPRSDSQLIDYS